MFIKNISQLLLNTLDKSQLTLREIGLQALEKAIFAVKPKILMEKALILQEKKLIIQNKEFNLQQINKIYIIGGGKATAEMASSLESILLSLKDIDYEGIINIPEAYEGLEAFMDGKISVNYASHPIPNENGIRGTKSMMKIIEKSKQNDLIFCLISGGGSSLLPLPKQGIKIKDLQIVNSLLLSSGASIQEINVIRKHLSDFKGGNLAKKLYNSSKATLISLIISDVVGDKLDTIASGPTVPDETTFKDALEILKKYDLLTKIPSVVKFILKKGLIDQSLETPKSNDICFMNVHNYLIGSVASAVEELKSFFNIKGFEFEYFSNNIIGEASEYGKYLVSRISKDVKELIEYKKIERLALIGTGELTVTIKGKGIGGRNQEMLLSYLNNVKNKKIDYNFIIIGANLDGIEGNSKAMGALIDNPVVEQMISNNFDSEKFLAKNDSNTFFKKLGVEIITGATGCNVNDILLILLTKKF